jgi:hypothetical protein
MLQHLLVAGCIILLCATASRAAATWDPQLWKKAAGVIADEARAKHNEFVRTHGGNSQRYNGLDFWSPITCVRVFSRFIPRQTHQLQKVSTKLLEF